MRIDYHIHTPLCGHACGEIRDYADKGMELGLDEIGFSDHFPLDLLDFKPKSPVTMAGWQLQDYIDQVQELQQTLPLTVRLGVEVDIIPGREAKVKSLLRCYPLDYVIGSLHFLGDWDFSHPAYRDRFLWEDIGGAYARYFQLLGSAAASGLYDIIGHPDVIKKFGFQPAGGLEEHYNYLAQQLKLGDACLEVNTAGFAAPVGEIYPSTELLRICCRQGVPVSFGSDAHRPEDVGRGWEMACRMMKDAGYTEVATFSQRQRIMRPLS